VVELLSDLTVRALKLPSSGPSYKAQNPWAVFFLCALFSTGNVRESLRKRIEIMASKSVTVRPNLSCHCSTIDVNRTFAML
jgi:hypothetical protein